MESTKKPTPETTTQTLLTHATLIGRLDGVVEQIEKRLGNIEKTQRWVIGLLVALCVGMLKLLLDN